jgi:hypothetical protein
VYRYLTIRSSDRRKKLRKIALCVGFYAVVYSQEISWCQFSAQKMELESIHKYGAVSHLSFISLLLRSNSAFCLPTVTEIKQKRKA